jgi:hypothetical protein
MMMNLRIDQGDKWRWAYTWTGHVVLGGAAVLQILGRHGVNVLLQLTEGAGVTLGADGLITIELTAQQTEALCATSDPLAPRLEARFLLNITPLAGVSTRVLEGDITLVPDMTFNRHDGYTIAGAQGTGETGAKGDKGDTGAAGAPVFPTGATGARPSATGLPAGTTYLNSTTHVLNIADGTAWRDAAGVVIA